MRLGSTNVQTVNATLKTESHSHRSTSTSDEYFSGYASNASSDQSLLTGAHYETPPSRISTPIAQQQPLDSEMTLPSRPTAAARPTPLDVRSSYFGNGRRREQINSRSYMNMSPPTPGMDDTPYIRFAIEQLTRDEELSGLGRQGSVTSNDYPLRRAIPNEGQGHYVPPDPPSQPPQQPHRPPSQSDTYTKRPVRGEVLLPIAPPTGAQWSGLGFVPVVLRTPFLLLFVGICLLMTTSVIFSNVYALHAHGLFDYDGIGTPRYFVFQFLPQLLGIIVILWLFVVEAAIYRVMPFFAMSTNHTPDRVLQDMPVLPANFVFPDFSFYHNGEPLLGTTLLVFWLANFTIPLLSCFYQTQWITDDGPARWRWTTVQVVGWILVGLYITLTIAVAYCLLRFSKKRSALMWDPVSIADLIPLFQRSNILADFERSEVSSSTRASVPSKKLRIGYWTTSKGPDIFHAIGEDGAPIRKPSFRSPVKSTEKSPGAYGSDSFDLERQRNSYASSFARNIHSPFVRYRWTPWFLRDSAVLAWIVLAIILVIAFLVVSFVNRAVQSGFPPRLPSQTRSGGFSSSNFLYSFLPSLLGMFLFLAWQPIDTYFRAIQPFRNLIDPAGASAEYSLLLDYPSKPPGLVTINAALNHDYRVAWISFVGLMAITFPIIGGGIFTAQFLTAEREVRMIASMPAYFGLCAFAAIYALSFLAVWPTRRRYTPHSIRTLADLLSFIYQSPLLTDPAFYGIVTKAQLVGRLVFPPRGVDKEGKISSAKYAFGIYIGRDGKEHLGIDRLQRPGSGEMLVTTGMMR